MKRGLWVVALGSLICAGCATPITKAIWTECEAACADRGGLTEACDELFRGPGCHCADDHIVWLEQRQTK